MGKPPNVGLDALRTSQPADYTRMLEMLRLARVAAWQYDVLSDYFILNDQFYWIAGTTAQAVGGYKLSSTDYVKRFVYPQDADLIWRAIRASIEATDPNFVGESEHRAIFGNGDIGYVMVRWSIVKDAQGRTVSLHGIGQDITDQKLIELRVAEAEAQFKGLMEQQLAGITVIRDDGTLAYVNPKFAHTLGFDVEKMVGRPFISFVGEHDRVRIKEAASTLFSGRPSGPPIELQIVLKDGLLLDVLEQSTLATWKGRPAIMSVLIDNSERRRTERAMQQTIEALASTVELRDPYTAGHQRRVAKLACAIARQMGMGEAIIETICLAGTIHDIGKVMVPAEILTKPGTITDLERQLIREHVRASYQILKDIEFPWPIAQIVLQHHERLDGSGYPQGLAGDSILLEAKILAVADVVESMISYRPYRPSRGLDSALREIEVGKGKLYDPATVDACTTLFVEKRFCFEQETNHN